MLTGVAYLQNNLDNRKPVARLFRICLVQTCLGRQDNVARHESAVAVRRRNQTCDRMDKR
jgi:hypothetical protein